VDDLALVHIVQDIADLLYYQLRHVFRDLPLLLEESVELARCAQLLDEVDMLLICEKGIKLDDVGVVEEGLNLYFPDELHQQLSLHVPLAYLL
jgi:hypothetical protein